MTMQVPSADGMRASAERIPSAVLFWAGEEEDSPTVYKEALKAEIKDVCAKLPVKVEEGVTVENFTVYGEKKTDFMAAKCVVEIATNVEFK